VDCYPVSGYLGPSRRQPRDRRSGRPDRSARVVCLPPYATAPAQMGPCAQLAGSCRSWLVASMSSYGRILPFRTGGVHVRSWPAPACRRPIRAGPFPNPLLTLLGLGSRGRNRPKGDTLKTVIHGRRACCSKTIALINIKAASFVRSIQDRTAEGLARP